MKISLKRQNDAVHLLAQNEDGLTVNIDGSPNIGGEDKGVRPMQLLLMGLAGCSSMDVISILNKQKQEIIDYDVIVEADRDTDSTPSLFSHIRIEFIFTGNVDQKKAERAVKLSMDKYCSVTKIMEKTATITHSVTIN
jgi:uncharacterized OsmC-like protein